MSQTLIEKIISLYKKEPRIAILMSGKGSNAEKILREAYRYSNLKFITICSDQANSRALALSQQYQLDYFCHEGSVETMAAREKYFQILGDYLDSMKIDSLVYAGFMKISTPSFVEKYPGINVHPADLTLCDELGKPKYIGMDAIKETVLSGATYLASTAHVVDCDVDCGQPIMVSNKLLLNDENKFLLSSLHEQLKSQCEHRLYPFVLELLSKGMIDIQQLPYDFNKAFFFSEQFIKMNQTIDPLHMAYLSQHYCSTVGFDFKHIDEVMAKVKEEYGELIHAYEHRHFRYDHFIEELGDCFFALINLCRFTQLKPEEIIKNSVHKYLKRCEYIESELIKNNRGWVELTQLELTEIWNKAKEDEKYKKNVA